MGDLELTIKAEIVAKKLVEADKDLLDRFYGHEVVSGVNRANMVVGVFRIINSDKKEALADFFTITNEFNNFVNHYGNIWTSLQKLVSKENEVTTEVLDLSERFITEVYRLPEHYGNLTSLRLNKKLNEEMVDLFEDAIHSLNVYFYQMERMFSDKPVSHYLLNRETMNLHFQADFGLSIDPYGVEVQTQKDYLSRVFIPLINNAKEHGQAGLVKFRFTADEEKKEITVSCNDDGKGIHKENLERIFDPDFSTKEYPSDVKGLGLSGVKIFVEENGGRIWAESELRKRTIFHFTMLYDKKETGIYITS
jgi:signal transduction histidine kinase